MCRRRNRGDNILIVERFIKQMVAERRRRDRPRHRMDTKQGTAASRDTENMFFVSYVHNKHACTHSHACRQSHTSTCACFCTVIRHCNIIYRFYFVYSKSGNQKCLLQLFRGARLKLELLQQSVQC